MCDVFGVCDVEDCAGGRLGDANGIEGEANRARGMYVVMIMGYDGLVWSVRWVYLKFGMLFVSVSFDYYVCVYKEMESNAFSLAY